MGVSLDRTRAPVATEATMTSVVVALLLELAVALELAVDMVMAVCYRCRRAIEKRSAQAKR